MRVELGSALACTCDGGTVVRHEDCWRCDSCGQVWSLEVGDGVFAFWNDPEAENARRAHFATQEALRTFEDLHDADVCSHFLVWLNEKGFRIPIRGEDTRADIIGLYLKERRRRNDRKEEAVGQGQAQATGREA